MWVLSCTNKYYVSLILQSEPIKNVKQFRLSTFLFKWNSTHQRATKISEHDDLNDSQIFSFEENQKL
jgi:hypothetical protein